MSNFARGHLNYEIVSILRYAENCEAILCAVILQFLLLIASRF